MLGLLVRRVWLSLLAAAPAPVLAWLDGWASTQAARRADQRRRALEQARPR